MTSQEAESKRKDLEACFERLRVKTRATPEQTKDPIQAWLLPWAPDSPPRIVTSESQLALGPMDRWAEGLPPGEIAGADRRPATVRAALREAVTGKESLLARWSAEPSAQTATWVSGFGNLGMNPGTLARQGGMTLGSPGGHDAWWVIEAATGLALAGPRLLRNGAVVPLTSSSWPDPRHLFLLPYLHSQEGGAYHFGVRHLLGNPLAYSEAIDGLVVAIPIGTEPRSPLEAAFQEKGYQSTERPEAPGDYHFEADHVRVRLRPGIYPHHLLVASEAGAIAELFLSGASNRKGVFIHELASALKAARFREALVLDNGADVGLYGAREGRFEIDPGSGDRVPKWPIAAIFVHCDPLASEATLGRSIGSPALRFLWKSCEPDPGST